MAHGIWLVALAMVRRGLGGGQSVKHRRRDCRAFKRLVQNRSRAFGINIAACRISADGVPVISYLEVSVVVEQGPLLRPATCTPHCARRRIAAAVPGAGALRLVCVIHAQRNAPFPDLIKGRGEAACRPSMCWMPVRSSRVFECGYTSNRTIGLPAILTRP